MGVTSGAALIAESCEISGNTGAGVGAGYSGTTVSLRETTIQDTRPQAGGLGGYGIGAIDGASLQLEACEVRRNRAVGIFASHAGTSIGLSETTIEGTRSDGKGENGLGIQVANGASLEATACQVTDNMALGVSAAELGTTVTLRETNIQDTQPNKKGEGGFGVQATSGASLQLESCLVSGNTDTSVVGGELGTTLSLRGTTIQDTRPPENGIWGIGIVVVDGGSLEAEACELSGNTLFGLMATEPGTVATLRETTIRDTQPDENGMGGYGIQVSYGAALEAEACEVTGSHAVGIFANEFGTSITLLASVIDSTASGEIQTAVIGICAANAATVEATDVDVTSTDGPGFYVVGDDAHLSCSGCWLQDNRFAGGVLLADASLELHDSIIEGTTAQENIGGGVGIYAEPSDGGSPVLTVVDTIIQDNPIAGVWLSGEGSYSLFGNTIHGGDGWTRETLIKCGDAVYARDGVTAWDGSSGLLLEDNEFLDGLGAGLFLDNASATLSGNSYADNAMDLVMQGGDCETPPDGYEGEAFSSEVELCPAHDYATCGDEFSLYLTLAEPESVDGAAFMRPGVPDPGALRLPAPPVTLRHALDPLPLTPPAPRLEPLELHPRQLRQERPPAKPMVVPKEH